MAVETIHDAEWTHVVLGDKETLRVEREQANAIHLRRYRGMKWKKTRSLMDVVHPTPEWTLEHTLLAE